MAVEARTRRKRRVLIVENYDGLGTFLASALREAGYNVTVAESGTQVRALALRNINVALVDAMLPGEPGTSLAAFFGGHAIPVIMMSGDENFIGNAGACKYPFLAKPFSIARLKGTLEKVLAGADVATPDIQKTELASNSSA